MKDASITIAVAFVTWMTINLAVSIWTISRGQVRVQPHADGTALLCWKTPDGTYCVSALKCLENCP